MGPNDPPPHEYYANWGQIVIAFFKIVMHALNFWTLSLSASNIKEVGLWRSLWRVFPMFLISGLLIEAPADEITPFAAVWLVFCAELSAIMFPCWVGWNPKEGSDELIAAVMRVYGFFVIGIIGTVIVKILNHFL